MSEPLDDGARVSGDPAADRPARARVSGDPAADRPAGARVSGEPAADPTADRPVGADATAAPSEGPDPIATSRLSDRTLWLLLAAALVALLLAIAFAFWINAAGPLHPVPVASRASA